MDAAFDCIVLGSGSAAATAAALTAATGARTLLVEMDRAPGPLACESLLPLSFPLLERLGIVDALGAGNFVPKYAVELIDAAGNRTEKFCQAVPDRDSTRPAQARSPQAWQVVRSEFDELLRKRAIAGGAVIRAGSDVVEVLFDGERATGVRLAEPGGRTMQMLSRVIIDASGRRPLVTERSGLDESPAAPGRMAIWGQYENAQRAAGSDSGSTLFLQTRDRRAWFWFIPLADNRVSIGVVGNRHSFPGGHGKAESVFEEQLVNCPAVVERLADARLVGSFHVGRDFSWSSRPAAGDGWLIIGEALAGWDPLFSPGLSLALKSAEFGAAAAIDFLQSGHSSADRLSHWVDAFARGERVIRRLVGAFATDGFCPFEFLAAHPRHRERLERLLAGYACDLAGPLLDDLDRWQNRTHPLAERPEVMH
jgi:flavin-dependent dehydrogenase